MRPYDVTEIIDLIRTCGPAWRVCGGAVDIATASANPQPPSVFVLLAGEEPVGNVRGTSEVIRWRVQVSVQVIYLTEHKDISQRGRAGVAQRDDAIAAVRAAMLAFTPANARRRIGPPTMAEPIFIDGRMTTVETYKFEVGYTQ